MKDALAPEAHSGISNGSCEGIEMRASRCDLLGRWSDGDSLREGKLKYEEWFSSSKYEQYAYEQGTDSGRS